VQLQTIALNMVRAPSILRLPLVLFDISHRANSAGDA
jgi:hypothetical protein